MEKKENILGTEKVGKLIRKFSIPCIISMVVNALYNIVDQIFVGQGVGYLGNGATNIIFPLTMFAFAFASMIGDGTTAYLSLKLGEKKEKEASKGVGNGIVISVIISIVISAICIIFLPQLIALLGCTDNIRPYALKYGYIIAIGFPFMTIGSVLNSLIRADGKPKYSMATMVTGAILNTIGDPIFIFGLHMGVEGAAISTIASQLITAILNILYIRKFKSIKLEKESFKLSGSTIKKLLALGISSFINQISIVAVIACENNMLNKCGAASKFGADIPITVLGIVMKISQILTSIIIGIAIGAQPIMGYNYGAEKYDRVKKTLKYVLGVGTIVSVIAFILFQTIPDKLIAIFGKGDELYTEFACMAFRRYLLFCFVLGIQIPAGIFFQSIGKSTKSAIISLSRQLIFLIPSMIILGNVFGIDGLLYSGPVADSLAFTISLLLLIFEVKNLNKKILNDDEIEEVIEKTEVIKEPVVITISRQYGSGGRYIAKLVAEKLGIKLYDKEISKMIAEKTGLSLDYIKKIEQRRTDMDIVNNSQTGTLSNQDELFVEESNLIKELASQEPCVIIGRCSSYVLQNEKNVLNVFVSSSMKDKIKRVTKYYNIREDEAEKEIKKINKQRANHYKHYTGEEWGKVSNYDICINSDSLGIEKSVELICQMANLGQVQMDKSTNLETNIS